MEIQTTQSHYLLIRILPARSKDRLGSHRNDGNNETQTSQPRHCEDTKRWYERQPDEAISLLRNENSYYVETPFSY